MADNHQPQEPIWAAAKARRQIDILKEVARAIEESERVRANQNIAEMTERDLEAEQLRLEDLLRAGDLTVDGFRRLREIDFYLGGMRYRRHHGPAHEEWSPRTLSDE